MRPRELQNELKLIIDKVRSCRETTYDWSIRAKENSEELYSLDIKLEDALVLLTTANTLLDKMLHKK